MAFRWKRKIVLFKAEVTPGTDPVPVVATNAMLVRNFRISPLVTEGEDRDFEAMYVGNKGRIVAGSMVRYDFDVELAGGGAAGTAPGWGPLIKACAFSETVNAGTSVVYTPVNPGAETTGTMYFYMDGKLYKALFSVGNVEINLPKGKIPLLHFTFIGIYAAVSDAALSAPTLTAFTKPVAVTNANTTPMTLHTYAAKFKEFKVSAGNVLTYRNLVNSESVRFTDRDSRGSAVFEEELVATKNFLSIAQLGTLGAFTVTHGTVAGNKVKIDGANVQIGDPGLDQDENIAMLSTPLLFTASSAGNDELILTVT